MLYLNGSITLNYEVACSLASNIFNGASPALLAKCVTSVLLFSSVFLQDLESCLESPEAVGACFLERVRKFITPYDTNYCSCLSSFFLFLRNI